MKPKILTTLKTYDRAQFTADLLAGMTVAMVALPLSLAIAIASGAGPERGSGSASRDCEPEASEFGLVGASGTPASSAIMAPVSSQEHHSMHPTAPTRAYTCLYQSQPLLNALIQAVKSVGVTSPSWFTSPAHASRGTSRNARFWAPTFPLPTTQPESLMSRASESTPH